MMICIHQIPRSNQLMYIVGSLTPVQSDFPSSIRLPQTKPRYSCKEDSSQQIGVQDHPQSLRPLDPNARCDWQGGPGCVFLHFASRGTCSEKKNQMEMFWLIFLDSSKLYWSDLMHITIIYPVYNRDSLFRYCVQFHPISERQSWVWSFGNLSDASNLGWLRRARGVSRLFNSSGTR